VDGFTKGLWETQEGFLRSFVGNWLFIPDQFIGWFPFALLKCIKLLRRFDFDAIYSTSDPFTTHLIGYCVKKLSGKPWLADFRDPWTQNPSYQSSSQLRQKIDLFLEGLFLKQADMITVTSEPTIDSFISVHPDVDENKFVVITNGFDTDDFKNMTFSKKTSDKFTITFTGRFETPHSYSPLFFRALRELIDERVELKDKIKIVIVGKFSHKTQHLLEDLFLDGIVDVTGYVPHERSIEYLLHSDVLLLTLNHNWSCLYPGKLFEYLAVKKSILAVVTEGATSQLIQELGVGIVVPPDDVPAIKQAILGLYEKYIDGSLDINSNISLDRFKRKNLTASLARYLNEIVCQTVM